MLFRSDTTKRATQERSNVLQEEDDENISLEEEVCEQDDKSLSLGMPMQPQEEDNEEKNDEENDEQLENEERKHPPSPPMRVTLKIWLMINFAFMILMMRKNINLCLMRTLLIIILKMMKNMVFD